LTSVHLDTARTWRGGQNQVLLTVTGLCELGHVHDPMGVALIAMALKMQPRLAPRPLIVASRRVDFHLKRNAFSRWKYRHIDVFIAVSGVIARMLVEDGIPAERIEVVHDGVNISAIDKIEVEDVHKAFFLPHGAPIVGNVAALVPHKGQKVLIEAAALVTRQVPDARFVILGEGELRDPLERQVKELGLERHVFLPGFRANVIALQKSFDIFAMSSVTEGLGSSMLDAMACGVPVVGTRAGGIPEAIEHGRSGLLVRPNHADELAAALVDLLKNPALRAQLGAAGRRRVEQEFSVEKMVEGTLAVYEHRLGARR